MDKKSDILRAAGALFAQFSLRKVTVDEIAEKASVSKATIYKYFDSKEEMFDKVVRMESEQLWEAVTGAVAKSTTSVEKFKAYLITKIARISDLVNLYRVTREMMNEYWPYITKVRDEFINQEKELVKGILEAGCQAGELSVDDVGLTAHVIVMSQKSLEYPWSIEGCGVSMPAYVDFLLKLVMNGIGRR